MKKSIFILASIFLLLLSCPIFAQSDPGDDPVPAAPIDHYIWGLALMGLLYVFLKLRAFVHQGKTTKE